MQDCIFCKIANGHLPAKIIYDSPEIMAFLDIKPANPGHILIIPKEHYQFIFQMPQDLNTKIMELIKILSKAQIENLGAQGVNILQNNGAIAGQLIPHLHFHIIPRFKDDKIIFHWEPSELKEEQFVEIQRRLIETAKNLVSQNTPQNFSAPEVKKETEGEAPKPKKVIKLRPRHA
ncbi:MAG: HIT family protein [Candidatus Nanoarchaeia archaeon]